MKTAGLKFGRAGGGRPRAFAGVTIPPTPTLGALTLSQSLIIGQLSTATINGATSGSTIASNIPGMGQPTLSGGVWTITGTPTGSAGTAANGLVETLAGATGSPNSSSVTTISAAFAAYQMPVQDWRAVASGVTDLSGAADAPMLAQQQAATTKTRGAGFTTSSSVPTGRIFTVPAGTRDLVLSFVGAGSAVTPSANSPTIATSVDNGATWQDTGYAVQTPLQSAADRRQGKRIARTGAMQNAGLLVRVQFPAMSSSNYTIAPLLHEWPASGKPPTIVELDNSQAQFTRAPVEQEAAVITANPGADPLIFSWGQPSANSAAILNSFDGLVTKLGGLVQYIHAGQMIAGADTSGYPSERPFPSSLYPDVASMHSRLDPIIDQIAPKIANSGLIPLFTAITYRTYTNEGPNALPGYDAADQQANGALPFNREVINPKIASYLPAQYDTTYARPKIDVYLAYLYRRSAINDGIHPTGTSGAFTLSSVQAWWAASLYRYWLTGAFPVAEIEQRINGAEQSLLRADYDEVVYALNAVTATAGKTAIDNRRVTLRPLTLLKTANLAVAAYETSKSSADKTTAQNAVSAAQAGGASASDVATAYGNAVNLSGTTGLTSRIAAVVVVTVTKRVKMQFASTAVITGVNAFTSPTQGQSVALTLTDGATASGHTGTLTTIAGSSPGNGINIAGGTAPNDFVAGSLRGYITGTTSTSVTVTLTGLDPAKKYRFYPGSGFSTQTADRSFAVQAVGANTVISAAVSATVANTAYIGFVDNVSPTAGGQITLTFMAAGTNSPQVNAVRFNGLNYEEYTAS